VGPDFWPALFFSLWHLVHNLFITYFFFSLPAAFSSVMLPDFCGNTEWHIWQSAIRSWCWRWGKWTWPLLPPFNSMFSAPLFWVARELTVIAPVVRAVIDANTIKNLIFIRKVFWNSYLPEGKKIRTDPAAHPAWIPFN
jgi:hypothetical protein